MTADGPLYGKYIVERTDGQSAPGEKHDGCEYFVLDLTHDQFAYEALSAYAEAVHRTHPNLAASIRGRLMEDMASAYIDRVHRTRPFSQEEDR